jgi:flagellar biosynthesis/type III secretory pathway M-ring protein FliF/YscJ
VTTEQVWLGAAGAVALVALVVAAVSWRAARRALAQTRAYADRLAAQEQVPAAAAAPVVPAPELASYVITDLDRQQAGSEQAVPAVPGRIDGRLFTDIVARETVVKAAAWTHGVRRALSPETRNRIRFQVRQQARQARRDRKAEMREALRAYRARTGPTDEGDAA